MSWRTTQDDSSGDEIPTNQSRYQSKLKKNKKKMGNDRGKKVPNLKHEKWWKVPEDAVGLFINHIAKYNLWMKGHDYVSTITARDFVGRTATMTKPMMNYLATSNNSMAMP
jgi:hypothetical protein